MSDQYIVRPGWCVHTRDETGQEREYRFEQFFIGQVATKGRLREIEESVDERAYRLAGLKRAVEAHTKWARSQHRMTGRVRPVSVHECEVRVRMSDVATDGGVREGLWSISFAGC